MSYFSQPKVERLTLPSNPEYWVDIKMKLTYGESKKFIQASTDGSLDAEVAADVFLQQVITEWNLDGEDGQVLPITPENLAMLDAKDAFYIIEKAGGTVEAKKAPAKNSSKASGATTTEMTSPNDQKS